MLSCLECTLHNEGETTASSETTALSEIPNADGKNTTVLALGQGKTRLNFMR